MDIDALFKNKKFRDGINNLVASLSDKKFKNDTPTTSESSMIELLNAVKNACDELVDTFKFQLDKDPVEWDEAIVNNKKSLIAGINFSKKLLITRRIIGKRFKKIIKKVAKESSSSSEESDWILFLMDK